LYISQLIMMKNNSDIGTFGMTKKEWNNIVKNSQSIIEENYRKSNTQSIVASTIKNNVAV